MEFKEKVAIITGGNSGIGKAIAIALAREGAKIVITARRHAENQKVAQILIQQYGTSTLGIKADVAKEEDCERLVSETVKAFGTIHILVNSAGVGGGDTIEKTSTKDFDRILKTNLYGTFWCARAAYKQMRRNKSKNNEPRGMIINLSSVAGKFAWAGTGAYSASKFGVQALTQALADEGKQDNIKVTAICPAMVATPMTGKKGHDYLQPEDVAETVLYLARLSPAAWPTEIVIDRKGAAL
ncbi:SDR family oxidoreductase [Pedosphaera parvula]|uniref:Short-chain dehydrogenase/reductase SDR n=1 Tax=Pedosphaera parvula (strain Ellin514) TaxID=320771 RepID=B9X9R2_PEDPL|nr:SDR family oxidoreductase [Pedosphaera parvula]EEF63210.1 short-chain dehydrogenase/reductase SDR [Pedosphaera parvula Ellin514]